jgi:hypothetical protein
MYARFDGASGSRFDQGTLTLHVSKTLCYYALFLGEATAEPSSGH